MSFPNPYMVGTPKGYTKHYYAGTERIATIIGSGGLGDMTPVMDRLNLQHDWEIIDAFYKQYQTNDPFLHGKLLSGQEKTEDILGKQNSDLAYQCKPVYLDYVDVLTKTDILFEAIDKNTQINSKEGEVYFYHGDHLGSANWITDGNGKPIQYIHYAPYGELIANQRAVSYDERYKFTGKERDWETGYDYFGARYLWSDAGTWLSVDPLADKYQNISPYAYCHWDPVKYVDPDGRDVFTINEGNGTIEQVHTEGNTHSYYLTNGVNTSYVGSFQQNENGLVGLSGTIAFNNTSGEACSFSIKDGNESRSFISPNALASLIGAVGSTGYTDVSVVGFSLSDGSSPSPSISHKNGNVGDLRYLRTDGVSAPVLVNGNNFDTQRNEALTSALHKFGWKDMISERVGGYLLPNTSAASERGIRTNHTNHLHIQGYRPSIVETYMGGNLTDIIVYGKRL